MKILLILIFPFLLVWSLILLLVILLPVSLVALPFKQITRLKITAPFWNLYFKLIVKTVFLARVTKIDERDEASKATIAPKGLYIANHVSFTDIPLIFSSFLIPPIMKKEVLYIPIFGQCAYSTGGIIVDRKDRSSRRKVLKESQRRLLEDREQLQYYPEGTRQKHGGMPKEFEKIKTALMEFAYDKNIPIYPVSMEGTHRIIQQGLVHPFRPIGIKLSAPLFPKDFDSKEEFLRASWKEVCKGKQELRNKIYARNNLFFKNLGHS